MSTYTYCHGCGHEEEAAFLEFCPKCGSLLHNNPSPDLNLVDDLDWDDVGDDTGFSDSGLVNLGINSLDFATDS